MVRAARGVGAEVREGVHAGGGGLGRRRAAHAHGGAAGHHRALIVRAAGRAHAQHIPRLQPRQVQGAQ